MAQLLLSTGTQLCCRTQMLVQGTPPPLWQAAYGGHLEVLTVLLPFTPGSGGIGNTPTDTDLSGHNAPDGTSPLVVAALASENDKSTSFELIRQMMGLYSAKAILAAAIRFGTFFN